VLRYKAMAFAASAPRRRRRGLLASLSTYLDPAQFGIPQSVYFVAIAVVAGCRRRSRRHRQRDLHSAARPAEYFQSYLGLVFALLLLGSSCCGRTAWRVCGCCARSRPARAIGGRMSETLLGSPTSPCASRHRRPDALSLDVARGAIQAVIGRTAPARAPCSTSSPALCGRRRRSVVRGRAARRPCAHAIARRGISRTFQNTELFGEMSALENVMVGLDRHHAYSLAVGISHGPDTAARPRGAAAAQDLLALVGLATTHRGPAALPFGKQRRLEIARRWRRARNCCCSTSRPPACAPRKSRRFNLILLTLRAEQGLTILVIDHFMASSWRFRTDQRSEFRQKIAEGDRRRCAGSEVIRAYLGDKAAMLSVRDLHAGYGGKTVLHGVGLDVPRGRIFTLLGANGAGKSTLLKAIVGLLPRTSAALRSTPCRCPTHARPCAQAGVALVPEQRELFRDMSVLDNLRWRFLRRGSRHRRRLRTAARCVSDPARAASQPARTLSGGERRCWRSPALMGPGDPAAGRASLGLAPKIVEESCHHRRISATAPRAAVEQNAALALDVAEYGYVLDLGEITCRAPRRTETLADLKASYL